MVDDYARSKMFNDHTPSDLVTRALSSTTDMVAPFLNRGVHVKTCIGSVKGILLRFDKSVHGVLGALIVDYDDIQSYQSQILERLYTTISDWKEHGWLQCVSCLRELPITFTFKPLIPENPFQWHQIARRWENRHTST